jgi:hypothetical protein
MATFQLYWWRKKIKEIQGKKYYCFIMNLIANHTEN